MNYFKSFTFAIIMGTVFLSTNTLVSAATIPFPHVEVLAKSISNGRVTFASTDDKGYFNVTVPVENGEVFNVFFNDESLAPIKMTAKKNIVSGRIVILTEGTVTKDPAPVVVKKPVVKKVVKPIAKSVTKPVVNTVR